MNICIKRITTVLYCTLFSYILIHIYDLNSDMFINIPPLDWNVLVTVAATILNRNKFLCFYQISMNALQTMEIVHRYATIQWEAINVHVALATNSQQTIEPALVRIC